MHAHERPEKNKFVPFHVQINLYIYKYTSLYNLEKKSKKYN